MSDSLLVPIKLEVLLASQALRDRDTFRQWSHTYTALEDYCSPEPQAFDGTFDDGDRTGAILHWTLPRSLRTSAAEGSTQFPLVPNRWLITRVWVKESLKQEKSWVLESDCPRMNAKGTSPFLVEKTLAKRWQTSLHPDRQAVGTAVLSQRSDLGACPVNIGAAFDLVAPATATRPATPWAEQAADIPLFMTAVAPGNLEFSAYVPFNEGVFSFFDDLRDDEGHELDRAMLSYQVTGWYSDWALAAGSQDILATVPLPPVPDAQQPGKLRPDEPRTPAKVLAALSWQLPDGTPAPEALGQSLYQGTATGLSWERHPAAAPDHLHDQLEHTRAHQHLTVALANTGVDAFSTLIGTQLDPAHGYDDPAHVVELLRAFHYDLLPLLNEPNGPVLLEERVRQEWFSSWAGGTQWVIEAQEAAPGTAPEPAPPLTTAQVNWLAALNQNQLLLDEGIAELSSLQWKLHAAWWKSGYLAAAGLPAAAAAEHAQLAVAAHDEDSLLANVLDKLTELNGTATTPGLVDLVPQAAPEGGGTQRAFQQAIATFVARQPAGLVPAGQELKAVARPRYWLPGNPTVLVSHVTPAQNTNPDRSLAVQLYRPLPAPVSAPAQPAPALLTSPDLPAGVSALRKDFYQLDPAAAAVRPPWAHDWHPTYLEWEVLYTAVPLDAAGTNWRFDGTDYVLAGDAGRLPPQTIRGRSLLSPSAQLTFKSRLNKFVAQFGGPENLSGKELSKLYAEIAAIDDWEFLSQDLTGFNEQLTQRDGRTFRTPTDQDLASKGGKFMSLAHLTGRSTTTSLPPYDTPAQAQGLVHSVPASAFRGTGEGAVPFHDIRAGQLYINHLVLYDKFGRQLSLVMPEMAGALDADVFPLVRDASLRPTFKLLPRVEAPVQLPPRLLQPTRLDLLLTDHRTQLSNPKWRRTVPDLAPGENPVGGWLLANHLDHAVLLFGPDGNSLGEVSVNAQREVQWSAPPHSPLRVVADLGATAPQVLAFVEAVTNAKATLAERAADREKTTEGFRELLRVIDSTLWTTDPLGDRADQQLSVLMGRPLALVAVQVQFARYGPALTRCDGVGQEPAATAGPAPQFSIRFGNLASREDGVIGYFENQCYDTFHSVVAPERTSNQEYVCGIGTSPELATNYLRLTLPPDPEATSPDAGRRDAALLTLLVDPRATIHATTGILPVKTLKIPRQFVHKPLAQLEISFRVGPLLSRLKPVPKPESGPVPAGGPAAGTQIQAPVPTFAEALSYLSISEKNGIWSWWEKLAEPATVPPWQGYSLAPATPTAALGSAPATLREGYLQFRVAPEPD